MRPLGSNKLGEITNLLNGGLSSRNIAQLVGVSKSSVNNIGQKIDLCSPRPKPGAPRKLSPRERREVSRMVQTSRAKTAVEVTREINRDRENKISTQTVRRALHDAGLRAEKKQKKPKLLPRHRKTRLDWARARANWTVGDFKRVIWSDESKINFVCSDGLQYVWKRPTRTLVPQQVIETVKYGGGHIMIWGCLTWAGLGALVKVEGNMNKEQYVDILRRGLIPTIDAASIMQEFPSREDLIFQQDGDRKHTASYTMRWLSDQKLTVMDWPPYSPDLNPIEHVWSEVKRRLGRYPNAPGSEFELWRRINEEWSKIPVEYCRALIESMPRRIQAVIRARGGNTKY